MQQGQLTVLCPACPQLRKNVPEDLAGVGSNERYVFLHLLIQSLIYKLHTDGFTHYSWPLMPIFASSVVLCQTISRTLGSAVDGDILWKKDSTRHTFAIMQMSRKR